MRLLFFGRRMTMGEKLRCTAIIMAAGKGKRMQTAVSKQFLPVCGKEILAWTVDVFEKSPLVDTILLIASADGKEDVQHLWDNYGWKKVAAVLEGGKERQNSVANGLAAVEKDMDIVLIHDGVRPFVTEEMIADSIAAAQAYGGAVIGVPAKDTIKVCSADGMAVETPDRSTLWQIQTPQTFQRSLIVDAYEKAEKDGFLGTDDASVAEFAGHQVKVVMGSYRNIKITTKEDLVIAEAFLKEESLKENKKEQIAPAEKGNSVKKESQERKAESKDQKKVVIYTDGACSGNPGAGGYGVVLIYGGTKRELSEGYRLTTNNRMEVLAVIKGLEALKEPCQVTLYSDSKYVVDAIQKGWVTKWKANGWYRNKKERASNVDLWERLLVQLERHQVTFQWVKGHADNPGNERCDELARGAIAAGNLLEDENYQMP